MIEIGSLTHTDEINDIVRDVVDSAIRKYF